MARTIQKGSAAPMAPKMENIFLADSTNGGFTKWKITTIPMVDGYSMVTPIDIAW